MNLMLRRIFLATTLVIGLVALAPTTQARSCSTTKTAGNWALTLTGTLILPTGPVPVAAVVRVSLEADGSVSGTEARSVGGGYGDETLTGTFSVNADCTGTTTVNFYEAGQLVRTSVLTFVVDDNNQEIRMVQKSLTLPNGAVLPVVITVQGRRIFTEED